MIDYTTNLNTVQNSPCIRLTDKFIQRRGFLNSKSLLFQPAGSNTNFCVTITDTHSIIVGKEDINFHETVSYLSRSLLQIVYFCNMKPCNTGKQKWLQVSIFKLKFEI